MSKELESVGLVGDLDDVELLEEFEKVFDVKFSVYEAEQIVTLGDSFELLCSKLENCELGKNKCLTAMSYYRISKALDQRRRVPLDHLLKPPVEVSPEEFHARLENLSNLELKFLTRAGRLIVALSIARLIAWIPAALLLDGPSALISSAAIIGGCHIALSIARSRDKGVWIFEGTVAEAAMRAAKLNYGRLVSSGGRWSREEVWEVMTGIIQLHTGCPRDRMAIQSKFF